MLPHCYLKKRGKSLMVTLDTKGERRFLPPAGPGKGVMGQLSGRSEAHHLWKLLKAG
jgi:hypothetical protein